MDDNLMIKLLQICILLGYLGIVSTQEAGANATYKALDFSLDNDCRPDENGNFTKATFQIENIPSSFTICSAFMVEAWGEKLGATLFTLFDKTGSGHRIELLASDNSTQITVWHDNFGLDISSDFLFYPLQWTRVCLSKDSNTSVLRLVVDGELLGEEVCLLRRRRIKCILKISLIDLFPHPLCPSVKPAKWKASGNIV